MPWADYGRLLRGRYGQRFPSGSGPDLYSFAYSANTGVGAPCLVGTPQFLTAARVTEFALDYNFAFFNVGEEAVAPFKFWQSSTRPWGKPGTIVRVPRVAVLTMGTMNVNSGTREDVFGTAVLDAVAAGVGALTAAGVSVFVGVPLNIALQTCPLLGPCFLTGSSSFVSNGTSNGVIGYSGLIDHATDSASAIGGDVWWGSTAPSSHVSFPYVFEGSQLAFYPTAEDAPTLSVDIPEGFTEYGADSLDDEIGSGLSVAALSKLAIWVEKLRSEEERLLPVVGRCRSFRWRWLVNGWDGDNGPGFTSPSKNCSPGTFVGMMNAGLNAGLIVGGAADSPGANGTTAGSQAVADMMEFFGL